MKTEITYESGLSYDQNFPFNPNKYESMHTTSFKFNAIFYVNRENSKTASLRLSFKEPAEIRYMANKLEELALKMEEHRK